MDYYFWITLSKNVPTSQHKKGMNTAICRAKTEEEAISQLLPEMRRCVKSIKRYYTMRSCYENPAGILKDILP